MSTLILQIMLFFRAIKVHSSSFERKQDRYRTRLVSHCLVNANFGPVDLETVNQFIHSDILFLTPKL